MTLLEKHREDYTDLKRKDLIKIVKECLDRNEKKNSHAVYRPLNTIRNNNRRALRKFFKERHTSVKARAKVVEKIYILRQLKKEMGDN